MSWYRYNCEVCGIGCESRRCYANDEKAELCRICRLLVKRVRERFRRAGVVPSHEQLYRAARVISVQG